MQRAEGGGPPAPHPGSSRGSTLQAYLSQWLQPHLQQQQGHRRAPAGMVHQLACALAPHRHWMLLSLEQVSLLSPGAVLAHPVRSPGPQEGSVEDSLAPSWVLGRQDAVRLAQLFATTFFHGLVHHAAVPLPEQAELRDQEGLLTACVEDPILVIRIFLTCPELLDLQQGPVAGSPCPMCVLYDRALALAPVDAPPGVLARYCITFTLSHLAGEADLGDLRALAFVHHALLAGTGGPHPPPGFHDLRLQLLTRLVAILHAAYQAAEAQDKRALERLAPALQWMEEPLPALLALLPAADVVASSFLSALCSFLHAPVPAALIQPLRPTCLALFAVPWPLHQVDIAVKAFLHLHAQLATAKLGLEYLCICLFEYPTFLAKVISSVLARITQTSHPSLLASNLRFISHLSHVPQVYGNFTLANYKQVFGVCLNCLRPAASAAATTPSGQASVSPSISVRCTLLIKHWFTLLRLPDREPCLLFIQGYLSSISMDMEALLDYLWMVVRGNMGPDRFTYQAGKGEGGNSAAPVTVPVLAAPTTHVLVANVLLSITPEPGGGVSVLVRRASGMYRLTVPPSSAQSERGTPPETGEWGPVTLVQELLRDPLGVAERLGLHLCPREHPYTPAAQPITAALLMQGEDSLRRSISVLDRTPFLDLFKVGVVLLTPYSTVPSWTEHPHAPSLPRPQDPAPLSNVLADLPPTSPFLSFLRDGPFLSLPLCTTPYYLGGLNHQTDGHETRAAFLPGVQLLLHLAPLMPNPDHDPFRTLKKRHIGNDPVVVLWNEGDAPNAFMRFGEFTLYCIVVQPLVQPTGGLGGLDALAAGVSAALSMSDPASPEVQGTLGATTYQIDLFHCDAPTTPVQRLRCRSTAPLLPLLWDACMESVVLLEERGINVRCCVERLRTLQRIRQRSLS